MYHPRTLVPSRPNFRIGRLAAPLTSEKKMIGITIIFSMAISALPNGAIHATVLSTVCGP